MKFIFNFNQRIFIYRSGTWRGSPRTSFHNFTETVTERLEQNIKFIYYTEIH